VSLAGTVLIILAAAGLSSYATTISFEGPTTPTGAPCAASDPACVIGGASFVLYGVQITQPSGANPFWTLTLETNYPALITGNVIPPAQWGVDLLSYSIADFMIHSNGVDYAIVLGQHIKAGVAVDSYVAGNLYQAPNVNPDFVPSGTNTTLFGTTGILPDSSRPNFPIWLAPGGTQVGAGTITVVQGGNGTPAQYTITDTFSAPAGFLDTGDFSISASSWACANGLIVGTGTFVGGESGQGGVPEPSTLLLFPTAFLLSVLLRRHYNVGKS